jgi:hypothetical protein
MSDTPPDPADAYVELVTPRHRDKPKFTEWLRFIINPVAGNTRLLAAMPGLFDLDSAVGDQLDKTGEWIGPTRRLNVELPQTFFSFDIEGLGFDQAALQWTYDPVTGLVDLPDDHYRILLYAKALANGWDGSIEMAYTIYETLFNDYGYYVIIQDNGDMTMYVGLLGDPPDAVTRALLVSGELDLRPDGVKISNYVFSTVPHQPIFAFDVGPGPPVEGVYFAFDTENVGFDEGIFYEEGAPINEPTGAHTTPPLSLGGFDIGALGEFVEPRPALPFD